MPLTIDWCSGSEPLFTYVDVVVFDAELRLTLAGEVIVDASWQIRDNNSEPQTSSELAERVKRYLLAPDREFLHVKLLEQGSSYYRRVWQAMLQIPLGETLSYSALAGQLDSGARAVARACSGNPYAGLIPCHRVVAKSGIGGFMGYTSGEMVELKRRILDAERQIAQGQA